MYTRGNAWYLNRDYFTVSHERMRATRPVLTVVGGNVVYDAGVL